MTIVDVLNFWTQKLFFMCELSSQIYWVVFKMTSSHVMSLKILLNVFKWTWLLNDGILNDFIPRLISRSRSKTSLSEKKLL